MALMTMTFPVLRADLCFCRSIRAVVLILSDCLGILGWTYAWGANSIDCILPVVLGETGVKEKGEGTIQSQYDTTTYSW